MVSSSGPTPRALKKYPRNTSLASSQVDGATDNTDRETIIQAWLSKVTPTDPPSKTAICRVSYSFERLPQLHVVPIQLTSLANSEAGSDGEFRPIRSQRLRKRAIRSFIEEKLPDLQNKFTLRLAEHGYSPTAENGPIDHILVLADDMQQATSTALRELSNQKKIPIPSISKQVRNGPTEAVHCDLEAGEIYSVSNDTTSREYWKMLKMLIREVTIRSVPPNGSLSDCKEILFDGIASESTSPVKPGFASDASISSDWSSFSTLMSQEAVVIKEAKILKVLFRSRVKVDPIKQALHLEFDLVPGLGDGICLSDLVICVLGSSVLTGPEQVNLSTIRSMLVGLHVARNHHAHATTTTGTGSTPIGTATGQDYSTGDPLRSSPRTSMLPPSQGAGASQWSIHTKDTANQHSFVIQDVKLAGEVPDFQIGDEKFSVHKYFATKILKKSLEYPLLPLAEIARNTWVPLETLITSGKQMITPQAFTKTLMKRARRAYDFEHDHEYIAKNLANDIIEPLIKYLKYDESEEVPIGEFEALTPRDSKESTETGPTPPKRYEPSVPIQSITLRFGIIYVKAKGVRRNSLINLSNIVHNLKAQPDDSQLIKIDPEFEHPIASIEDTKPLLLISDFGGSVALQTLYNAKPNTILAIIDSTGRSASELRNIRADLQKFGNRKIGAVTFCMTEKNFDQSMRANMNKPNYFPQKVLQSLTVMHGKPLFTTDVLNDTSRVLDPIIIGAHISHPAAGCAEHCPSVAAVVASIDEQLTIYPGSVRLQPTYNSAKWQGKHLKRKMEYQILDLGDMMVERLEAWKRVHPEATPSIVFYRDSIGYLDKPIIDEEKSVISAALNTVFGKKISCTYVVVNRYRESPYDTPRTPHPTNGGMDHFTTSELEGSNKGRQYRYFVEPATEILPQADLDMPDLARLTYNLNTSFQLDKRVAIALPLYYARKLALHTFNYFRFAVTNRFDLVPSMLRRLHGSDAEAEVSGKEMVKVMCEYLFSNNPSGNNEVSQPFGRHNPWLEQLDEKMFYI